MVHIYGMFEALLLHEIKLAPVIKELEKREETTPIVCVTGQHRQMLDQVLKAFDIVPDFDLNIMQEKQTLTDIFTKKLGALFLFPLITSKLPPTPINPHTTIVADGIGVIKGAKLLKMDLKHRVLGVDLALQLLSSCHELNKSIYLLA